MTWLLQSPRRLYGTLGGAMAVLLVLAVAVVAVRIGGPDAPRRVPADVVASIAPSGDAVLLERAAERERLADPLAVAADAVEAEPRGSAAGLARLVATEGSVVVVDVRAGARTARVTLQQTPTSYSVEGVEWR